MIRTALLCAALLPALALAAVAAEPPQYYNEVYTFSNGGGNATSTGYILDACVGQPAVGATWKDPSPTRTDLTGSESYYAPVFFPMYSYLDLVVGYNLIALPQLPDDTDSYDAARLIQEINTPRPLAGGGDGYPGGEATRVLRFNGSGYDVYTDGGVGENFALRAGEGYFVRCSVPSRWRMRGYPFLRANPTIALASGYNLVGLNVSANPPYDAASAVAEINGQPPGDASRILRFNGMGYDVFTSAGVGLNFGLRLGEGYFIRSSANSTWTLSRD